MRYLRLAFVLPISLILCSQLGAQPRQPEKKRILAIGQSKGWQHDAMSHGLATIWKIGQESGAYETFIRTDTELITKTDTKKMNRKNLDYFDAVLFYTSGELDMDDKQKADLLAFVKEDGKGFIAVHSGNDTFYDWPEYGEMVGGYFDGHPWNRFDAPIILEDREHPITAHFPKELVVYDEIYQAKNFSRDRVRVLMRLDETKLDMSKKGIKRTDGDFAVSWVRDYGKGRVFYTSFGHETSAWDRPDIQKMFLEAVRWVTGVTKNGDATPRPRP